MDPTTRRLRYAADVLDVDSVEVDAADGRAQIVGPVWAIDTLLDRVRPERPIADCDGQLHLFDPAAYTTSAFGGTEVQASAPTAA